MMTPVVARCSINRMQRTPRLRLGSMEDVRGAGSLIQRSAERTLGG